MPQTTFKKLLTYGLIGVFAVIFFVPIISRAAPQTPAGAPTGNTPPTNTTTIIDPNSGEVTIVPPAVSTFQNTGSAVSSTNNSGINALLNLDPTIAGATTVFTMTLNAALYFVLTAVTGLLAFAGIALDWAISFSVTNFAQNIYNLTGINTAWQLIRDLANMSFIFILVFEGIRLMFGHGPGKKIVVSVIIAAVLINFSLFFTEVIIDASNVVTVSFYNNILKGAGTQPIAIPGSTGNLSINQGLSDSIMQATGISTIFDQNKAFATQSQTNSALVAAALTAGSFLANPAGTVSTLKTSGLSSIGGVLATASLNLSVSLFFSSIFTIIAAFIFLAMTVLFLVRYLYFIFLLILSPVAYLATIIPGFKKTKDQYWETLLGQCYFAPVFMIMIWITLTVVHDLAAVNGVASLADMFSAPSTSVAGGLMNYLLVIGMLIFTMIVAKNFAKQGGMGTATVIDKGTSWVGGAVFGGSAALARNTIGAKANSIANNEDLKARAAKGEKWAQLQLKTSKYVASGSFDARRSAGGESLQKTTGVNFGKGIPFNDKAGTGGYEKKVKDKIDAEKKYADSLKPSDLEAEKARVELASDKFKDEEKERKEVYLKETYEDKISKATEASKLAEKEKEAAEAAKKPIDEKAKKISEELEKLKKDQDEVLKKDKVFAEELKKLEKERDESILEESKKLIIEKIELKKKEREDAGLEKSKKDLADQIDSKAKEKATITSDLAAAQATADEKIKIFKDAEEKKTKILEEQEKERVNYISKEATELIAIKGGQEEKKDKKGNIVQREVKSTEKERKETYATTLETKPTWTRLWMTVPKPNKQAAIAIRGSMKKKGKDKALEDLLKAAKDEAKESGEGDDKEEKEEKPTTTETKTT